MTIPFKFELGEILHDIVTGYEGVAMGRTQYYTGCNHYGLLSRELGKEGQPKEWQWFDETRLCTVPSKKRIELNEEKPTSGPHPNAPEI